MKSFDHGGRFHGNHLDLRITDVLIQEGRMCQQMVVNCLKTHGERFGGIHANEWHPTFYH